MVTCTRKTHEQDLRCAASSAGYPRAPGFLADNGGQPWAGLHGQGVSPTRRRCGLLRATCAFWGRVASPSSRA